MTFTQIEVIWKEPTTVNVQNYFPDMKKYSSKKYFYSIWQICVFLPLCFYNRTTQLGVKKEEAKKLMDEIWDQKEKNMTH